jgi:hypothetical protein
MRRRVTAAAVVAATAIALLGVVQPASATHGCTEPGCNPITVAILEGIGFVCNAANVPAVTNEHCTYRNDALHTGELPAQYPDAGWTNYQGLTWPGAGPPGDGPFSFNAGPDPTLPTSFCASTAGGAGCQFRSHGDLRIPPSQLGPYCGSSLGDGRSTFTSGDGKLTVRASFGWTQSAATILPLQGEVSDTDPEGGEGATVVGFTSSRGTANGGNCGITQITTAFNVEGMIVTF